ncbi:hypothetical protein GCM10009638_13480 [Luteococcus sanguinis]
MGEFRKAGAVVLAQGAEEHSVAKVPLVPEREDLIAGVRASAVHGVEYDPFVTTWQAPAPDAAKVRASGAVVS